MDKHYKSLKSCNGGNNGVDQDEISANRHQLNISLEKQSLHHHNGKGIGAKCVAMRPTTSTATSSSFLSAKVSLGTSSMGDKEQASLSMSSASNANINIGYSGLVSNGTQSSVSKSYGSPPALAISPSSRHKIAEKCNKSAIASGRSSSNFDEKSWSSQIFDNSNSGSRSGYSYHNSSSPAGTAFASLSTKSYLSTATTSKRKRRASLCDSEKDLDSLSEPLAKKQQLVPSSTIMSCSKGKVTTNEASTSRPVSCDSSSMSNINVEVKTEAEVSSTSDYLPSKLNHEESHDENDADFGESNDNKENENCSSRILRMRSNSVICDSDSDGETCTSYSPASSTSLASEAENYEDDDINNSIQDSNEEYDSESSTSDCESASSKVYMRPHRREKTYDDKLLAASTSIAKSNSMGGVLSKSFRGVPKDKCLEGSADRSFFKLNNSSIDTITMVRQCPLPALAWANAEAVWQSMCKKDELTASLRDSAMMERHPGLNARMRAILLDWMIEVCEVYKLHRETYYLAVDYLDRYLNVRSNVQKTHLQLIGVTCLFVAAKSEEIYPPKITDFAYVTDGACRDSDILHHEILLLQALDWYLSPITAISWLGIYMQLNVNNRTPASLGAKQSSSNETDYRTGDNRTVDNAFIYPQFSGFEFIQTAQLLDLCTLDVGFSNYSYSVLAAAAMSHTFNRVVATRCSGMEWKYIEPCAEWMEPFFVIVSEEATNLHMMEQNEQTYSKFGLGHICPNIVTDDSHILQTHTINMNMLDRGNLLRKHTDPVELIPDTSPATDLLSSNGMLTPPASSRKPPTDAGDKSTADKTKKIPQAFTKK